MAKIRRHEEDEFSDVEMNPQFEFSDGDFSISVEAEFEEVSEDQQNQSSDVNEEVIEASEDLSELEEQDEPPVKQKVPSDTSYLDSPQKEPTLNEADTEAESSTEPEEVHATLEDVVEADNLDEVEDEESSETPKIDFEEAPAKPQSTVTWASLHLSRTILKAVHELNYEFPTPIQASAIPYILQGRDVAASAITGSGKTAAFALPIIDRLTMISRKVNSTRCIILSPTRELAHQQYRMFTELNKFHDLRVCLLIGGTSVAEEQAQLRAIPDVVIATPGRLLDHSENTPFFTLDDVEVLVLDEADKLLSMGFKQELELLISRCPRERQTLLFSATMTEEVSILEKLSLRKPVRVSVGINRAVTDNLTQEIVKINATTAEEGMLMREAILMSLLSKTFTQHVIVFFQTKLHLKRFRAIADLNGLNVTELHGDLTQVQRVKSLSMFEKGSVDILLATDVAARGLDIEHIQTVINVAVPRNIDDYIHRVGRTARAGRSGTSVTIVNKDELLELKKILKKSKASVIKRSPSETVINGWMKVIEKDESSIAELLAEEKSLRQMEFSKMRLEKVENMEKFKDEIMARPKKTWAVDKHEANKIKDLKSKLNKHGNLSREEDEALQKALRKEEKQQEKARLAREKAAKLALKAAPANSIVKRDRGLIAASKLKKKLDLQVQQGILSRSQADAQYHEAGYGGPAAKKAKKTAASAPKTQNAKSEDELLKEAALKFKAAKNIKQKRSDKSFKSLKKFKRR